MSSSKSKPRSCPKLPPHSLHTLNPISEYVLSISVVDSYGIHYLNILTFSLENCPPIPTQKYLLFFFPFLLLTFACYFPLRYRNLRQSYNLVHPFINKSFLILSFLLHSIYSCSFPPFLGSHSNCV